MDGSRGKLMVQLALQNTSEECMKDGKEKAKEWLFRHVFNEEYNLSFKLPDNDTCDKCDELECKIKNCSQEHKEIFSKEKEEHLFEANRRYKLKAEDKENCGENEKVIMVDLQKCLPTPYLSNSESFYLRKLWTLNYIVYDSGTKSAFCMMYGGRGGNEMASCFLKWAECALPITTEKLTVWSDNCAGQNKNHSMILMYLSLLHHFENLQEISHKYLLCGHSHMEVDTIHSMIERKKKRLQTMQFSPAMIGQMWQKTVGEISDP